MKAIKLFLVAILTFTCLQSVAKIYQVEDGTLRFRIDTQKKEASVMKCLKTSSTGTINIPDDILLMDDGKTYKVKGIEACAFQNCKLKAVRFPVSLVTIESNAFAGCPNFYKDKKLEIPDGVKTIGMEAFKGGKFTSLSIPSSVTKIDENAFSGSAITTITFAKPKSSLEICFRAFANCKQLTALTLPSGVTKTGQAAFSGCTALTSVSTPATLTTISSYCFEDCKALKTVTLPSGLRKIDFNAFMGSGIEHIDIPNTVSEIGQYAFAGSTIRTINLPAQLTSVGYCLFTGCANLTAVVIPGNVTTIESGAFYDCTSLASVIITSKVKYIEQAAFYGCDKLMTVRSDNPTPPICSGTIFSDATLNAAELIIPQASHQTYKTANQWRDFKWFNKGAVEEVYCDDNADAIYYDLKGNLYTEKPTTPGLYIRRQGATTTKLLIP